jgi:hypothetical protein
MTSERWRQIEDLFHAARERTGDERAALLAGADAEVRGQVEALLARDESGKFLDRPAPGLLQEESAAAVTVGTQVGPYRIEAQIGQGGMGVVYRARDTKLNRPVAIKFLSSDVADTAARRRFQREAQMASSLNHPHILTVHDAGEYEGLQYLVTEFIDGGTLKGWARDQKRPGGHVWVPMDDHNCWAWSINFRPDRPLGEDELREMRAGKGIHCEYKPGTFRTKANKDNDYLIDRKFQKEKRAFSGVLGFSVQDSSLQESMGPIQNLKREKLLPTDRAIVMARRMLHDAATALQADAEPPAIDADQQRVRAAGVLLPRDKKPQEWAALHLADGKGQPVYSL